MSRFVWRSWFVSFLMCVTYILAGCREGSDPCGEALCVPRRLPSGLFCDMPAWLGGWLRAFFLCARLANLFDALATCHAQGDTCAPPASYGGACGSMSFKGLGQSELEAAVLKCRSDRHTLRVLAAVVGFLVILACSVSFPCAAPSTSVSLSTHAAPCDRGFAACPADWEVQNGLCVAGGSYDGELSCVAAAALYAAWPACVYEASAVPSQIFVTSATKARLLGRRAATCASLARALEQRVAAAFFKPALD